jgi:antitoxin VapB
MALSIKSDEADLLARRLAAATGESLTEAVTLALRERLHRVGRRRGTRSLAGQLDQIAKRCASLPIVDSRTPDEILGYGIDGLPR